MFRPSLRSNWSLVGLAILSLIVYYFAQTTHKDIKMRWYEDKMEAAKTMQKYLKVLKAEAISKGYNIDKTNDPNETGLIGKSVTSITTSRGLLSQKLTSLNPNLAAVFIEYLKKMNLDKGDYVAVGFTGANPGANLALYAALETMELNPVIIVSLGSAGFGANRLDFTWLDMEAVLYQEGLINFQSHYASLGGSNDNGRGLSKEGRNSLIAAIKRNNCTLINSGSLTKNIDLRMDYYQDELPESSSYQAFINLGGAKANVGEFINAKLIKDGINRNLADFNFDRKGCIAYFAMDNIPILHAFYITKIADRYGLPIDPEPLPKPGTGKVFINKVNNVTVAAIGLGLILLAVTLVILFDRKDRHFTRNIVDPDKSI